MKNLDNLPLIVPDSIVDGSPYVDVPVYVRPRVLINSIRSVFGLQQRPSVLVRYKHTELRWMKPGTDGNLVPRT